MTTQTYTATIQGKVLVVETADGQITYDARFLFAAMLIYVAKGSGQIEPEESALMIRMLGEYFHLESAASLELLSLAMNEMRDRPELGPSLASLASTFTDKEKEDLAYMALRVIAADGRREAEEMEQFNSAIAATGIAPDVVHRAFDRYFAETMPDASE